jgi:hypothetical protein
MDRLFLDEDLFDEQIDYATPRSQQQSRWSRLRDKARRLGIIMRIVGLTTNPLSEPALPPSPPPITARSVDRPRGSGSRFDEFDKLNGFDTNSNDLLGLLEDKFDSLIDTLTEQSFVNRVVDTLNREVNSLERGTHGYFPFGRSTNRKLGRLAANPRHSRYPDELEYTTDESLDNIIINKMDAFHPFLEEWLEEDIDAGRRGQRKSKSLTTQQRQGIRNLAVQAARNLAHRRRRGRSRRNIDERGIARKANNIESRVLRMIDSCNSYEQAIAWMRRNYGL